MKIKPIILERIQTRHTNYILDLIFDSNVTFVTGDSGVGKSAVYSFLQEYSSEDKRIRCLNYIDHNKGYRTSVRNSKGKLFVIDNADLLLDDKMRQYVVMDTENQYLIIGRNPSGLMLTQDDINELESESKNGLTVFKLKKAFV